MNNYNKNNVFMQIILGNIKSNILFQTDNLIIIEDLKPKAKFHYLAIPLIEAKDFSDFLEKEKDKNISLFFKDIKNFIEKNKINNFRLLTNKGINMGQEIFHFHVHILSND